MQFKLPPTVSVIRAVRGRQPQLRIRLGGRAMRGASALAHQRGVELEDP
ncbi:MAG TPA: hypothetical protein VF331_15740 [Polyangiales bacterium]